MGESHGGEGKRIYRTLGIVLLLSGLLTIDGPIVNPAIVFLLELFFVIYYLAKVGIHQVITLQAGMRSIVLYVFTIWALVITLSLFTSPINTGPVPLGISRFIQTLMHVLLFFLVRDLLLRYPLSHQWTLLSIPIACLTVALGMIGFYILALLQGTIDDLNWFNAPPFNSHIRHTGYQVSAGISVLFAFLAVRPVAKRQLWSLTVALAVLCAFLFWMGGRGSIIGVGGALIFVFILLLRRSANPSRFLVIVFACIVAGLVFSELFAVFDWNGILETVTRTVGAKTAESLSSGRTEIWAAAWAAFVEHPVLGLGPGSYIHIPNKFYGVQPHSMILQFLLEWGVAGTILFAGLLIHGFVKGLGLHVLNNRRDIDAVMMAAGSIIVCLTVQGPIDGTYFHPQPSLFLAVCFAFWTTPGRVEDAVNDQSGGSKLL